MDVLDPEVQLLKDEINQCLNQETINNKWLWFLDVYEQIRRRIKKTPSLDKLREKILEFRNNRLALQLLQLFDKVATSDEEGKLIFDPRKTFAPIYDIDLYNYTVDKKEINIFDFINQIDNEVHIELGKIKSKLGEEETEW